MLTNIDINKMNRLMEENKDAKTIITQLLEKNKSAVIRNSETKEYYRQHQFSEPSVENYNM